MKNVLTTIIIASIFSILPFPAYIAADGCAPGQPCYEEPAIEPAIAPPPPAPPVFKPRTVAPTPVDEPVYVEEAKEFSIMPFYSYYDYHCPEEGQGVGILGSYRPDGQNFAIESGLTYFDFDLRIPGAEFDGDLYRIPVSVAYYYPLTEEINLVPNFGLDALLAGGFDGSEDLDDTIGAHVGLRAEIPLDEDFGAFIGSEYIVADTDGKSDTLAETSIDLDGFIHSIGLFWKF